MIHSTKFDNATIARSKVARRKGNRVRFFDPTTARMSGWHKVAAKTAQEQAAALNKASARIGAQQLASVKAAAKVTPDYAAMTVPALRELLATKYGLTTRTRERKAALVNTLTELSTHH